MSMNVAFAAAMLRMTQHMQDIGVCVGDVVADKDKGFKFVDVIMKFNHQEFSAAKWTLRTKKNGPENVHRDPIKQASIDKQTAEFRALIKPTSFLRTDGVTYIADGVTLEGIFKAMLLLDGPTARDFRAANSDVFMRHLAGDETLDLERLANSISTDPIKAALRERLLARRAAGAPVAAPVARAVVVEPVASQVCHSVFSCFVNLTMHEKWCVRPSRLSGRSKNGVFDLCQMSGKKTSSTGYQNL